MWQKAPSYSYIADAVRAGKTASLGFSWGLGKYSERRKEHPVRCMECDLITDSLETK